MAFKKTYMQKYRLLFSYVSTAIIYGAVFGIIFYMPSSLVVAKEQSKEKKMELSLSTFVPEVIIPPKAEEKPPKEEPLPKKEEESKKEPVKEEIIPPLVPKVIPIPKPLKKIEKKKKIKKKVVKKKKIKKKVVKKKIIKKKRKQKTTKKRSTKKSTSKKSVAKKSSRKQRKSSKAQKNRFLSKIRNKINAKKAYPRIAKKRRMQGSVKVKFTILRSGRVGNISVSGKRVFFSSAKEAVKSAFPVNVRNIPLSLPMNVSVTLHYRIR